MTDLERDQIQCIAIALNKIGETLERECIEGRHIDLATTRHYAKQLKVSAQLLGQIAVEVPCENP